MSSRGRGYISRGYRGSGGGYRGSNYRSSNSRGSYGSPRGSGRGNYYQSNDRYASGGGERFSGRMDDGGYKKPYRNDGQQYGSRDYGGRAMSPERKRMRLEGPSSDRRSHDGGIHYGGGGYSARREYQERSNRRSPSRELYRKSPGRTPGGGGRPMRSGPPRRSRGMTLRGRSFRTRGTFRSRILVPSRSLRSHRTKITTIRSQLRPKLDSASSTEGEEDWDANEEKKIMKEEGIEPPEESPKHADETAEANEEAEGAATDKEAPDVPSGDEQPEKELHSKMNRFIPLICTHCKEKCVHFGVYQKHLNSHKHKMRMADLAYLRKMKITNLRAAQRRDEKRLEEETPVENLSPHTIFCAICKLNHRQLESIHIMSEHHLIMKKFLHPYCEPCRLPFRSPMTYEHHLCSLDHLKRKACVDATYNMRVKESREENESADEGLQVDLDNFMTLDSVGDVDEIDDDSESGKKPVEVKEKKKVEINVGSEHIKKVEVLYCELCKVYITRGGVSRSEEEVSLRRHCHNHTHLTRYVRHRDTRTLRQHAERIHRIHQMQAAAAKDTSTKKEKNEEKSDEITAADSSEKAKEVKQESANSTGVDMDGTEGEEKLWADVDKDLGDLLREVDQTANKSSDDEDESNTGRYDRFRKSEKKPDTAEDVNGEAETTNGLDVKVEKVIQPTVVANDTKQTT